MYVVNERYSLKLFLGQQKLVDDCVVTKYFLISV